MGHPSSGYQFAEKLARETSGAKALLEKKGLIAALKALRHPKASFSANCYALRPSHAIQPYGSLPHISRRGRKGQAQTSANCSTTILGQHIVEIVRDSARQTANRLEPLSLLQSMPERFSNITTALSGRLVRHELPKPSNAATCLRLPTPRSVSNQLGESARNLARGTFRAPDRKANS
jgi:hypothetical protein